MKRLSLLAGLMLAVAPQLHAQATPAKKDTSHAAKTTAAKVAKTETKAEAKVAKTEAKAAAKADTTKVAQAGKAKHGKRHGKKAKADSTAKKG